MAYLKAKLCVALLICFQGEEQAQLVDVDQRRRTTVQMPAAEW